MHTACDLQVWPTKNSSLIRLYRTLGVTSDVLLSGHPFCNEARPRPAIWPPYSISRGRTPLSLGIRYTRVKNMSCGSTNRQLA